MSGHHPLLMASRYGCRCECSCGWQSVAYTTASGAHCAFGAHLLDAHAIARMTAAMLTRWGPELDAMGEQ